MCGGCSTCKCGCNWQRSCCPSHGRGGGSKMAFRSKAQIVSHPDKSQQFQRTTILFTCVRVCLYMFRCVSACSSLHAHVSLHRVHVCFCLLMFLLVHICLCLLMLSCVSLHAHVFMCVSACSCFHVCLCLFMCLCILIFFLCVLMCFSVFSCVSLLVHVPCVSLHAHNFALCAHVFLCVKPST